MQIIPYFGSGCEEKLRALLPQADWSAARFLSELLEKGTFFDTLGGEGQLYFLLDGENLVSFLTLTRQDAVRDEALFPWIGFVFTMPGYRGHRYAGILLEQAELDAAKQGHNRVYIATDHIGLYEKYGYTYQENRIDCWGEDQRVLLKDIENLPISLP